MLYELPSVSVPGYYNPHHKKMHMKHNLDGSGIKCDYFVVENANFRIDGNKLFIDYGNGSAVLQRVS